MLACDAERLVGRPIGWLMMLKLILSDSGFLAVALFRWQSWLYERGLRTLARVVKNSNLMFTGAEFMPGCKIGPGLVIRHPNGIVVGGGAIIGMNCTLLQQVTLGERTGDGADADHAYPVVGNNVVLSAGAKLIGGIRVHDNAVVGANAVVLNDVPANFVAVGVPAKNTPKRSG